MLQNKSNRNKKKNLEIKKYNFSIKSKIKTLTKKFNLAIKNNDTNLAKNKILILQSFIDRQSRKKIISKNKSSRLKSKLMKKINLITKNNTI